MKSYLVKKFIYISTSVILTFSIIFSLLIGVSAFAENEMIIKNGDFEKGFLDFKSSEYLDYNIESDSNNVHQGEKSLKLGAKKGAWNNAFLYHNVSVEKNSYYEWHMWFKSDNETNKPCIGVRTADGKNLLPSTLSSNGGYVDSARSKFKTIRLANNSENWSMGLTTVTWKEYIVTFFSEDENSVLLTLDMFYSNRSGYTDDWTINKTDAPSVGVILNGKFDEGVKKYTNDKLSIFEVTDNPDDPGNKVLKVSGNSTRGNGIVYQKVGVKQNTDYSWSFKFNQSNNVRGDYTKIVLNSLSWQSIDYKVKTVNAVSDKWGIKSMKKWSELQIIFNSGNNEEVLLGLNLWADTVTVLTDDWTLSEYSNNTLKNSGFEEDIKEFSKDQSLTINQDSMNNLKGNNSLKVTGSGFLRRTEKVKKYYDMIWSFYLKSDITNSQVKASIISTKTGKLISSTALSDGNGSITPKICSENEDKLENYYSLNTENDFTKYEIKFNSLGFDEVNLVISFPGKTIFYSDEWYLGGDLSTAYETLYNPGFEDGDFETYSYDPYISASIVDEDVHSGKYALKIKKDETVGYGYFWQTVNVKENSDYIWTFWAKFNSTSTPVGAEPRISGGGTLISHIDGDVDTIVEPSFAWHRLRYCDNNWHKYSVTLSTGSNNKIDLAFLSYASLSEMVIDDWNFEYISDTPNSNKVIDVDFESEKMGSHEYSKQAWVVTDEQAHSGSHSIKFFGRDAVKGNDLLYRDKNGVICDNTYLSINTKYCFSFWYKGNGNLDLANLRFNVYSPGKDYIIDNYYGCENENWNYFEYIFDSKDSTNFRFQISAAILGSAAYSIYIDDIKLIKLEPGITAAVDDTQKIDASSNSNIISNGNIQNSEINSMWYDISGANVVFDETNTNKVIEMGSGKESINKKFVLKPDKEYRFSIKYRYKKNDGSISGKLGLLCNNYLDENGNISDEPSGMKAFSRISDEISIVISTKTITNKNAWDDWSSFSYDFIAPNDGIVYLSLDKTSKNGLIQLDDIYLECLTPNCVPIKDMTKIKTDKTTKKSIWDLDFDFDLDWNEDQDLFDCLDEDTIEPEEEIADLTVTKNPKKYLRVKRKKLIKKGNSGIPDWIIIVSISALVIIVGGATSIIVLKKHKFKNKIRRI